MIQHYRVEHSNNSCTFLLRPHLFTKEKLVDFKFLNSLQPCTCFEYAYLFSNPNYSNTDVDLVEWKRLALASGEWIHVGDSEVTYSLNQPHNIYRDPFIKDALKEYDPRIYYSSKDKNKTPRPGRMFFSLLQYNFPTLKKPSVQREKYFYKCLNQAKKFVFSNFDNVDPLTSEQAFEKLPKSTSAGWLANKFFGHAVKKGDMMDQIVSEYYNMFHRIEENKIVNDYTIFAMRGHLSYRYKIKTRPVWLVSATTIISETKYYSPFYEQLNNKKFFRDRVITGKGSMKRLREFLLFHEDYELINTDISGWDSFRAAWFHEDIIRSLGKKINFRNSTERKEYNFIIDQAIRTKVLLPDGSVFRKRAGIISGTMGTLLFNTLLNMILTYTVLCMMKVIDFEYGMNQIHKENWLGDDFAFYRNPLFPFDFDRFRKLILKYFALVINKDKTVFASKVDERKYLGYQLKGGLLYRDENELFQAVLYSERYIIRMDETLPISFSRIFSYLLLGGINNNNFTRFFYYFLGKYKNILDRVEFIYNPGNDNVFKLIKDIWNINISKFSIDVFRNMNLELLKYVMFFDVDLITEKTFL